MSAKRVCDKYKCIYDIHCVRLVGRKEILRNAVMLNSENSETHVQRLKDPTAKSLVSILAPAISCLS